MILLVLMGEPKHMQYSNQTFNFIQPLKDLCDFQSHISLESFLKE